MSKFAKLSDTVTKIAEDLYSYGDYKRELMGGIFNKLYCLTEVKDGARPRIIQHLANISARLTALEYYLKIEYREKDYSLPKYVKLEPVCPTSTKKQGKS